MRHPQERASSVARAGSAHLSFLIQGVIVMLQGAGCRLCVVGLCRGACKQVSVLCVQHALYGRPAQKGQRGTHMHRRMRARTPAHQCEYMTHSKQAHAPSTAEHYCMDMRTCMYVRHMKAQDVSILYVARIIQAASKNQRFLWSECLRVASRT